MPATGRTMATTMARSKTTVASENGFGSVAKRHRADGEADDDAPEVGQAEGDPVLGPSLGDSHRRLAGEGRCVEHLTPTVATGGRTR